MSGLKTNPNIDQKRLEIDEGRLHLEERIRQRELDLRIEEMEIKQGESKIKQLSKHAVFSPTFFATSLAVLAGLIGYWIQSEMNRDLEREKFQGQMILKAIETGDQEKAKANLLFLVSTGLLPESDEKLRDFLNRADKDPKLNPVLPPTGIGSINPGIYGVVLDATNGPIADAKIESPIFGEMTSASDGSFRLPIVGVYGILGVYGTVVPIKVSKEGYLPFEGTVVAGPSAVMIILKKEGEPAKGE